MAQGAPGQIEADLEVEAKRLLDEVVGRGLQMRLIGGMAIRLLAGNQLHPAFVREIGDLDFVVTKGDGNAAEDLLTEMGYVGDEQFNALNGARRLLFHDPGHDRQIDVFVQNFEMCHALPLAERIDVVPCTLPAAEVLMTKLQIVDLNAKDRADIYALLLSHDVGAEDAGFVNGGRIAELSSRDWGLQHTFELNLDRLRDGLDEQPLDQGQRVELRRRIDRLGELMDQEPKSRKWKMRARVGDRKRWYEEVEEVDRAG